ncbi:MAG: hypothetical protein AVDCRST_MAG66-1111, partial [uncultured Pseudonocardia sp.]
EEVPHRRHRSRRRRARVRQGPLLPLRGRPVARGHHPL